MVSQIKDTTAPRDLLLDSRQAKVISGPAGGRMAHTCITAGSLRSTHRKRTSPAETSALKKVITSTIE